MAKRELKSKSLMIQGTASSVGKSLMCTAICRILARDGYNVNPFKSQNMSLNSYITIEGHEMGRAQVMQAEACGKLPEACMNPILLKPVSDRKSQVIIEGGVYADMDAVEYFNFKPRLKERISDIYRRLEDRSDIVVIEGAGSPAEINLNHEDFVNMGMAKIAKAPVLLVGDIDRGGVFASLAGTMLLLSPEEKKLVKGVIINKFRGSPEILKSGIKMLEEIINVPVLGVIPYFSMNLEDEDSVSEWLKSGPEKGGELDIAVIRLPYMSNHTDFNALRLHEDVSLRFAEIDKELGEPDVIILPGTKSTIHDMLALKKTGMDKRILNCHSKGSVVFGICGGYQMLGKEISDKYKAESDNERSEGLGLLNAVTEFRKNKFTTLSKGRDNVFGAEVRGYEIHMGETAGTDAENSFITISERGGKGVFGRDGMINKDLTVFGTYIHGIFDSSEFTRSFLNFIRRRKGLIPLENLAPDYWVYKEGQYDKLAEIVRSNLDMDKFYEILKAGIED
ncbi:MAG TPA: cobyric acid synthase [Bacillota bacterium]|nr:cobyric acid synthase [Bacillota bacterium]HQQ44377.1 cobyric acid synthase [Bacillota bacterium]